MTEGQMDVGPPPAAFGGSFYADPYAPVAPPMGGGGGDVRPPQPSGRPPERAMSMQYARSDPYGRGGAAGGGGGLGGGLRVAGGGGARRASYQPSSHRAQEVRRADTTPARRASYAPQSGAAADFGGRAKTFDPVAFGVGQRGGASAADRSGSGGGGGGGVARPSRVSSASSRGGGSRRSSMQGSRRGSVQSGGAGSRRSSMQGKPRASSRGGAMGLPGDGLSAQRGGGGGGVELAPLRDEEDWKQEDPIYAQHRAKLKHQRSRSRMDDILNKVMTPRALPSVHSSDNRDPGEGLKWLLFQVVIVFILVMICLGPADSGCVNIIGDVGLTEVEWKYGYVGRKLKLDSTDEDGSKDHFSKYAADDAGNMYLLASLMGLIGSMFAIGMICLRWQSGYLYYNECCCGVIRLFHRQSINVCFGFVKQLMWIAMIWFLAASFYSLIELNYYVHNNCAEGFTCSTEIIPDYGWLCLMATVFMLSCCTYVQTRKIDPPLTTTTVQFYLPEHEDAAESASPPIKLHYVLEAQEAARNVLIYSMFVYFMHGSALLLVGFTTSESAGLNIIGQLQPLGWGNIKGHPSIIDDDAKALINAGQSLGSAAMTVWWGVLFIWLGLLYAVRHFHCHWVLRSSFTVFCAVLILFWIYGCLTFYYSAYSYWGKDARQAISVVEPTAEDESIKSRFMYPDWGCLALAANSWNLYKMVVRGYKGLEVNH